jgi:hypothetical protein
MTGTEASPVKQETSTHVKLRELREARRRIPTDTNGSREEQSLEIPESLETKRTQESQERLEKLERLERAREDREGERSQRHQQIKRTQVGLSETDSGQENSTEVKGTRQRPTESREPTSGKMC